MIFQFPWKLHRVAEDDRFREGQSTFWCVVRVRVRNSVRYSGARQVVRIFWLNHLWQLLELGTGVAQHCSCLQNPATKVGYLKGSMRHGDQNKNKNFQDWLLQPVLIFLLVSSFPHHVIHFAIGHLIPLCSYLTLYWGLSRCYDDGSTKDLSVSPSVVR